MDKRTKKTNQKIDKLQTSMDGLTKIIKDHIVEETAFHKLKHQRIDNHLDDLEQHANLISAN